MRVAVAGASGFIGRRLSARLVAAGHFVQPLEREFRVSELDGCDAAVNLAGEPVAQRWTAAVKRAIRDSRVHTTRKLVEALGAANRPRVLVNASAVGYYGDRGDEVLTESSAPGQGFLPEVCVEWEREALAARERGARVALIRIGFVLGPNGGALAKMVTPFRLGVGGRLGSGKQWMSWVHLDDLCALFEFALSLPVEGALNGVSPNPVTNTDFTLALARTLRRPAVFTVPRFALHWLYGDMSQILFDSQRAVPRASEAASFRFHYEDLAQALKAVLT
jgi:uncharacterized protein (TIGR01777 family)